MDTLCNVLSSAQCWKSANSSRYAQTRPRAHPCSEDALLCPRHSANCVGEGCAAESQPQQRQLPHSANVTIRRVYVQRVECLQTAPLAREGACDSVAAQVPAHACSNGGPLVRLLQYSAQLFELCCLSARYDVMTLRKQAAVAGTTDRGSSPRHGSVVATGAYRVPRFVSLLPAVGGCLRLCWQSDPCCAGTAVQGTGLVATAGLPICVLDTHHINPEIRLIRRGVPSQHT
jgi:hypothetical protein